MVEWELRPVIEQALAGCMPADAASVTNLAGAKGAYALLLHVAVPVRFERRGKVDDLSGWFVYAGNAYGGGGMAARLARHFRRDKPLRWHVDQLTTAADAIMALTIHDGRECEIVDRLLATGRFETALPGFGSSDCRHCAAHLLRPYLS